MKRLTLAIVAAGTMHAHAARGQSLAVGVDQTVGHSTENISAAATQFRTFGELRPGIRFNVEGAWATRTDGEGDAFEAAYPYAEHLQVIEAYGERLFAPGRGVLAIRVGRYRTPFGIYSGSDQGTTASCERRSSGTTTTTRCPIIFSSTAPTSLWAPRVFARDERRRPS